MLTLPNILAAYLYVNLSDHMPEPVLDEDGNIFDLEADNELITEWALGANDYNAPDHERLAQFIYETERLLDRLVDLELDSAEPASPQYMGEFYNAARATFDNDTTQLRTYFRWLYLVVFQREDGPRWGEFVDVYGVDEFCDLVRDRFASLIVV